MFRWSLLEQNTSREAAHIKTVLCLRNTERVACLGFVVLVACAHQTEAMRRYQYNISSRSLWLQLTVVGSWQGCRRAGYLCKWLCMQSHPPEATLLRLRHFMHPRQLFPCLLLPQNRCHAAKAFSAGLILTAGNTGNCFHNCKSTLCMQRNMGSMHMHTRWHAQHKSAHQCQMQVYLADSSHVSIEPPAYKDKAGLH